MKKNAVQKAIAGIILLAVLSFSLLACATQHRRATVVYTPRGKVVVIKKGHAHSNHCGHYRYNKKWYYVKGHVHGKKCGHAFVSGVWVIR